MIHKILNEQSTLLPNNDLYSADGHSSDEDSDSSDNSDWIKQIFQVLFDHIYDKGKTSFKYPNRYHPNPKKFFNITALLLCESVAGTLSLSLLG